MTSVNNYRPHLLVLAEDDADREIAIGFCLASGVKYRNIDIRPCSGGWSKVVQDFNKIYASEIRRLTERRVVLLIDFDGHPERLEEIKNKIPEDVLERVFILGVLYEPQDLVKNVEKKLECIGEELASNCIEKKGGLWEHDMLKHNMSELKRMEIIKPWLFDDE